jgi:hypothetical protein
MFEQKKSGVFILKVVLLLVISALYMLREVSAFEKRVLLSLPFRQWQRLQYCDLLIEKSSSEFFKESNYVTSYMSILEKNKVDRWFLANKYRLFSEKYLSFLTRCERESKEDISKSNFLEYDIIMRSGCPSVYDVKIGVSFFDFLCKEKEEVQGLLHD